MGFEPTASTLTGWRALQAAPRGRDQASGIRIQTSGRHNFAFFKVSGLVCNLLFMRNHHKLRAFALADQLAILVYRHSTTFPKEEMFGLTSQMRRAAVSVASNIVEGCARSTTSEYLRFLEIAYGAAQELKYQVSLAHRLSYLREQDYNDVDCVAVETCKVLSGLIRSLKSDQRIPEV